MTNVTVDPLGRIPMSPGLAATIRRAHQYADAQSHAEITLEHLLLALTEDLDAGDVLTISGVDMTALKSDVAGHLGRCEDRRPPGAAGGAELSADVRRILEAAAAAAQGRRREIDGAIVVAAIVGDGTSTAAHILRARGLTFEEAIKALQSFANREPGLARPRAVESGADDILASARQRVATRTAPGSAPAPAQPEPPREARAAASGAEARPITSAPGPAAESASVPPREPPPPQSPASDYAPDWEPAVVPAPRLPDKVTVPGPVARPPAAPPATPSGPPPLARNRTQSPSVPSSASTAGVDVASARESWTPPSGEHAPVSRPSRPAGVPPASDSLARPMGGSAPRARVTPPGQQPPPPPPPVSSMPRAPVTGPGSGLPTDPAQLRPPPAPAPPPAAPRRAAAPGAGRPTRGPASAERGRPTGALEPGQMVENIPRSMQVAVPRTVEIRIAKTDAKALAEGLQGSGTVWQHDVMISKAMSVRLRAPDGGFFVETASPETQWIENHLAGPFADEYASWRFTITPKVRGTKRLLLVVSVRTVGGDGLAAETALPDQVFEVKVRTNYGLAAQRWTGWLVAAVAGGLLARFGDGLFDVVSNAIKVLIK